MYTHGTEVKIVTANIFGDGNHESTQIVLDALYEVNPKGKDVLDIGTGTGVLSIYAKKWGAENVLAVDTEYQSIICARDNFKRNDVEVMSRLNIYNEYLDFKADIIVVNLPSINVRDFIPMAHSTMKADGVLICSWYNGFNLENECDLSGWDIKKQIKGTEWSAYILERK